MKYFLVNIENVNNMKTPFIEYVKYAFQNFLLSISPEIYIIINIPCTRCICNKSTNQVTRDASENWPHRCSPPKSATKNPNSRKLNLYRCYSFIPCQKILFKISQETKEMNKLQVF